MTARGTGSRNSPIVIDDDEDDVRLLVHAATSTGHAFKDAVKAQDPTEAPREDPHTLKEGIGYSMLVRMGFKPGYGLGVNLEGITSPVRSSIRQQKSLAGLGAPDPRPPRGGPSKDLQQNDKINMKSTQGATSLAERALRPRPLSPMNVPEPSLRKSPKLRSRQGSPTCPSPAGPLRGARVVPSSARLKDGSNLPHEARAVSRVVHDTDSLPIPTQMQSNHSMVHQVPSFPVSIPFLHPFQMPAPLPLQAPFVPMRSVFSGAPAGAHVPQAFGVPTSTPVTMVTPPPQAISPPFNICFQPRSKGVLGVSLDNPKLKKRGYFPQELQPPPAPPCALVMQPVPRKCRSQDFAREWLIQFDFQAKRIELSGEMILFEFGTPSQAKTVWGSSQMAGSLQTIRLFWYRGVGPPGSLPMAKTEPSVQPPKGEMEQAIDVIMAEPEAQAQTPIATHAPTSSVSDENPQLLVTPWPHRGAYDLGQPPPQSSPLKTDIHVQQDPDASAIPPIKPSSSSPHLPMSAVAPSSEHPASVQTDPRSDAVDISPPEHLFGVPMDINDAQGNPPLHGVSGFTCDVGVPSALVCTSSPPTSLSTVASSCSSISPPLLTPQGVFDAWAPTLMSKDQSIFPLQGEQPHHPGVEVLPGPRIGSEATSPATTIESQSILVHPMQQTADSALAKEAALRRMVLQSKKRKVATPTDEGQKPCSASPSRTVKADLEVLAESFIADAINRPPPSKRRRLEPSAETRATWEFRLSAHIEKSKNLMAQVQSASSKEERARLFALFEEQNRCVILHQILPSVVFGSLRSPAPICSLMDEEKKALYSEPMEDTVPSLPWPAMPEAVIVYISDSEGEESDCDEQV
ncbi:hypothetical protein BC834DRAFT_972843 [Gloeopeniophorella convolvens]|nr:hypothetical protein BC834DRAFT_972843 [Gloeopeniophorella convolvens]